MKLAAIGPVVSDENTKTEVALEQTGNGTWKSIVDFHPAPSSAQGLSTKTEIKISAASETTRKGVCRLMVKVAVPYSALYASDTATGDSNLKFSSSRSNGEVSAHMVLTLPKECVADIVQQKGGSVGRIAALAHAKLVTGILQSLRLTGNGVASWGPVNLGNSLGGDGAGTWEGPNSNLPVVATHVSGTPTFTVSESGFAGLETVVDRAARGYTPFADRDAIGFADLHA